MYKQVEWIKFRFLFMVHSI